MLPVVDSDRESCESPGVRIFSSRRALKQRVMSLPGAEDEAAEEGQELPKMLDKKITSTRRGLSFREPRQIAQMRNSFTRHVVMGEPEPVLRTPVTKKDMGFSKFRPAEKSLTDQKP